MACFMRARVFAEGPGWQLREYQEFKQLEDLDEPNREELDQLAREALDGYAEALTEALEETRLMAGSDGLPPGVSYQQPTGLVIVVEKLPTAQVDA